jgi:hypothetical protein
VLFRSTWFHDDDWLDFNMFQSGHGAANIANYTTTLSNYQLKPVKPTLDGEPRYEDHPINWKPANGWFDEYDVRQAAYWSVLSGASGHTYGNHNVWQMWQTGRKPISSARTPWREAILQPGAVQMGHMRRLLESCRFEQLEPGPELLVGPAGNGADHVSVARTTDRRVALVYLPTGKSVEIRLDRFEGKTVRAEWFDPHNGSATEAGEFPTQGSKEFKPQEHGRGHDVVLVLRNEEPKPRLVFVGAVQSIENSPLPRSLANWVVTFSVDKVKCGEFAGESFSFRIHSPIQSGLEVGKQYTVEAERTETGYHVDTFQWIESPERGRE